MFYNLPLVGINPGYFNYQMPIIPKSDCLIKRQYQQAFDASTELLDTQMRPTKKPKVSTKVKKVDENSLSAAAIVDPISLSTNKNTADCGLAA
jgi:hypothetical protein